jgi:choloylglycine hydrolase
MCTRIQWSADGQPVLVGRNMDWTARQGTKLWALPKGVQRSGLTEENPLTWTSKFGSVGAFIWDCSSTDGLNEAGLAVNTLYLAEAKFGQRDPSVPGLSMSLWVQYYLDTCATVAEVVEAAKALQVRPVNLLHKGVPVESPVHLSVSDSTNDSAIIEILEGEVHIHHGAEFTTMTNSPPYDEQLVLLKQYEGLGGRLPIPGTMEAEDRFARSAFYLTKLSKKPETYQAAVAGVLSVIRNAATPLGANDPVRPNISATIWRSISDCTNKRYYFEFTDMPNVVWVDLDKLDLSEGAPALMFDLANDFEASGEVSGRFQPAEPFEFLEAGGVVTWKPDA